MIHSSDLIGVTQSLSGSSWTRGHFQGTRLDRCNGPKFSFSENKSCISQRNQGLEEQCWEYHLLEVQSKASDGLGSHVMVKGQCSCPPGDFRALPGSCYWIALDPRRLGDAGVIFYSRIQHLLAENLWRIVKSKMLNTRLINTEELMLESHIVTAQLCHRLMPRQV